MSDEIIDVESSVVADTPSEITDDNGMNIPDPDFIDDASEDGTKEIEARREELEDLPDYPTEWQSEYDDEDSEEMDELKKYQKKAEESTQIPLTATFKQEEINKLIKKYKRYMKSNLHEIRRLDTNA